MDCGTFSTSILLRYLAIPIKVALVRVCMKYGSWQLVSELPETSQQGRINIWTLFTGEKKLSLYHRAERYETSVEKLQWLPIRKPGESDRNGCNSGCFMIYASVVAWIEHLSLSLSVSLSLCLSVIIAPAHAIRHKLQESKACLICSTSAHGFYSVGLFIPCAGSTAPLSAESPLLLLSCGGDGPIRVWLIKVRGNIIC